jgi:glutaredoxin 3
MIIPGYPPWRDEAGQLWTQHPTEARMATRRRVIIYTTPRCGYCGSAKALLRRKGAAFDEVDIQENDALRRMVVERSGRTTVPQVFIDDVPVGGFDDLVALDREGRLDAMLAPS